MSCDHVLAVFANVLNCFGYFSVDDFLFSVLYLFSVQFSVNAETLRLELKIRHFLLIQKQIP